MNKPHRWKAGESGNPSGRPKVVIEIRNLARAATPAAFRELVRLAAHAENENARVAAIKEILDRGYGKSTVYAEVKVSGDVRELTDAELIAIATAGGKAPDDERDEPRPAIH